MSEEHLESLQQAFNRVCDKLGVQVIVMAKGRGKLSDKKLTEVLQIFISGVYFIDTQIKKH